MVAARNKARYQKEMAAQSWIGSMGKGGWSFLTRNSIQRKKRTVLVTVAETYVKTIHAGIDGLKVDTQVLKLLRILFVEHYKHTLVIFV